MVELARTSVPILETKKIVIYKNKKHKSTLNLEVDYFLRSRALLGTDLLKKTIGNLYLYFFVLNDEEFVSMYPLLSSSNRRQDVLKSIIKNNTGDIRNKQDNYYRIRVSDILKNYKNASADKKEFYKKIKISYDMKPKKYSNKQSRQTTSNLHLVSFLERGINTSVTSSNDAITYDLILTLNNDTQRLQIPENRNSYFVRDPRYPSINNRPYQGPAHFHSANNPAPDGYVGWMAGHEKGRMGPKLFARSIPNYKVQSDNFSDLRPEIKIPINYSNMISDTGSRLENASRVNYSFRSRRIRNKNLLSNSIFIGSKKNESFVTKETPQTSHFRILQQANLSYINSGYCGSIIGINTLKLLKNNSRLSEMIAAHLKKRNFSVLRKILNFFEIKSFCVKRKKILKDYKDLNSQRTKVISSDKNNDYGEEIITSRDFRPGSLSTCINSKCSIEQINLMSLSSTASPFYIRNFFLKDYDLFHNFDHGEYTYEVEVLFEDAPFKYLKSLSYQLQEAIIEYSQYVELSKIPESYRGGRFQLGYYNPENDRQNKLFANENRFNAVVNRALSVYKEANVLLSGDRKSFFQLSKQIRTYNFNLKSAQSFLSSLVATQGLVQNFINKFVSSDKETKITSLEVNTSTKAGFSTNTLLKAKSKTNIVHDISNLNELLIDNVPTFALKEEIPRLKTLIQNMTSYNSPLPTGRKEFLPNRYVDIKKARYEIDHNTPVFFRRLNTPQNTISTKLISNTAGLKMFSNGRARTFLSRRKYTSMNNTEKFLFDTKISTLKVNRRNNSSLKEMPPEFFPGFLQTNNSSIRITASGFSQSKNTKDQDKIFEKVLGKIIPDMSVEVQKNVLSSVFSSRDITEFENNIDNSFKEQIALKKSLGIFYENYHRYLSFNKLLNKQRVTELSYKQIFEKGEAKSKNLDTNILINEDIFETEKFTLSSITSGVGIFNVNRRVFNRVVSNLDTMQNNGFIFLKLSSDEENKSPSINNGILVRL
jgi:hypothetical protein